MESMIESKLFTGERMGVKTKGYDPRELSREWGSKGGINVQHYTQDFAVYTGQHYADYSVLCRGLYTEGTGWAISLVHTGQHYVHYWLRVFSLFSVPYTLYNAQDNTTHEIGETYLWGFFPLYPVGLYTHRLGQQHSNRKLTQSMLNISPTTPQSILLDISPPLPFCCLDW